jgi:hypothetical protein
MTSLKIYKDNIISYAMSNEKRLNEEKHLLINESKDEVHPQNKTRDRRKSMASSTRSYSAMKNKYQAPQLFSKILEVYNRSIIRKNKDVDNADSIIKNYMNDINQNMLLMLKTIEKNLDFLIPKYFEFSKNPKTEASLREIEYDLDEERKKKKNIETKKQNLLNEQRKRKEIEDRNNKVYIIPKRKIPEKCPPKDTGDKKKKNESSSSWCNRNGRTGNAERIERT